MIASIPKKVTERILKNAHKYSKIISEAVKADINESDTVLIVRDMLEEIFGYNRYTEITTEYAIRNVYCDVAIKVDSEPRFVIEVKAIGTQLNENHLRQAAEYCTKINLDYVILTNGQVWKTYKLIYKRPIKIEEVFEINWFTDDLKDQDFLERIFALCKEGLSKTALTQYYEEKQAMNKYTIGAILLGDLVLDKLRKEIRRMSGINVDKEALFGIIKENVLKREVIEGEEASDASKRYKSHLARQSKTRESESTKENEQIMEIEPTPEKPSNVSQ